MTRPSGQRETVRIRPVAELRAFLRAALFEPVGEPASEAARTLTRRRWIAAATFAVGIVTVLWTSQIRPGDPVFYLATLLLAAVWTVGALLGGPLRLGRAHTRSGTRQSRAVVQSLVLGLLLVGIFFAGAVVAGGIPVLREPLERLLDHARFGWLPLVVLLTSLAGIGEELFFRGALFSAMPRRHAVALTTLVYTLSVVPTGIPLLVLAAAVLGVVAAMQRRVTGGVLGPIVTHVTWSLGMLFLLPPALALWH